MRSYSSSSELGRLRQDGVRHGELPDVVEHAAEPDRLELPGGEAQLLANGDRDPLHAPRVSGRVRILGIHRRVQRLDGLERSSRRS